jgi:hypothetical protein
VEDGSGIHMARLLVQILLKNWVCVAVVFIALSFAKTDMSIAQDSFRIVFVTSVNGIHNFISVDRKSTLGVEKEFEMLQKRTLFYIIFHQIAGP